MNDWLKRFQENDNPLERLNKGCDQIIYKPKKNGTKFGTTRRFAFCLKLNKFNFKCSCCRGVPV